MGDITETASVGFSPAIVVVVVVLLSLSAFFSASETAFFSIRRLRLRSMAEEKTLTGPRVARLMTNPGRLLTTILIGNMIVNVLIGVLLGTRLEWVIRGVFKSEAWGYVAAVAACTSILVLFGEITPKVFAVSMGERFARFAIFPLVAVDAVLAPVRKGLLRITDALFQATHFHDLRAAPFITDDEFRSVLSDTEAQAVLEDDERQIIQGILEFRDVLLREILVPRPDVVALAEDATVGDALDMLRRDEYSRMPVYRESLDTVIGILVVKDLIPSFAEGEWDRPVKTLMRPAYFVPETMTLQQFVDEARRHRVHLAVVVDEYGGSEGIVTLEDALEEVVGDIMDEGEQEQPEYERLADGVYRVQGSLSLDGLSELVGIQFQDEEHETVAGFLMNQTEKVPESGDEIEHNGVRFTVEACEGKRALMVRVQILNRGKTGGEEAAS